MKKSSDQSVIQNF